jgi:hypothetical protein
MTNDVLDLSPELDMLRVPLIVSTKFDNYIIRLTFFYNCIIVAHSGSDITVSYYNKTTK